MRYNIAKNITTARKLALALIVLLAVAGSSSAQYKLTPWQKLSIANKAITELYVDSVDNTKISEEAIKAMLKQLDPHSTYTNAEETKELNEPLSGNFSGIGVQFNMRNDTLYVIQTVSGGPSEKVGILPGDRIIAVNDTSIAGVKMKTSQIMKRLRGKKGTKVTVEVLRKSSPAPIFFTITRADIPLYSIDASYIIDQSTGTGYIRLSRFAATSYNEFMTAVEKLKKEGLQRLIIDLSNNGGGYLETATEIANEFLNKGQLIVYTEGRNSKRVDQVADGKGSLRDMPLVILVNQYSASASEIVSGAIQDWDRGVIVGRRTFGKGLVQRAIPFPDNSMIRLTVARYYTPSGRCIQKPYDSNDTEAYSYDIVNRYKSGELMNQDSIHFLDSLKVTTLKAHRTIYGGGGIMPDKFVPLDTTHYSQYYNKILASGTIYQYSLDYVDANRAALKAEYTSSSDFIKRFNVGNDMLQALIDKATANKIEYKEDEFNVSKEFMSLQLKALIGRDIFDDTIFYRIMNTADDIVNAGLDIISDKKQYKMLLQNK